MSNFSQRQQPLPVESNEINLSDVLTRFEQLSQQFEQLIKNDIEFIEAKKIYLQLKEVRIRLIEYENNRLQQNSNEGLNEHGSI